MRRLKVGDRIKLWDGYDGYPTWLKGLDHYSAIVIGFIENEREPKDDDGHLSAIIEFEEDYEHEGIRSRYGYINTRYVGQRWTCSGTVHIHLSDRKIESPADLAEAKVFWLESHASYRIV